MTENSYHIEDALIEIPLESKIEEFESHLKCHPRTILSAKFGDGKSYFLSKLMQENRDSAFSYITLFPINYQVLENGDIFQTIKYDILIQLAIKGIIDATELTVTDEFAFFYLLQNNRMENLSCLDSLASVLSAFSSDGKMFISLAGLSALIKFFDKIKKKANEIKDNLKDDLTPLSNFIDVIDKQPIKEFDAISKIIRESITKWHESNEGKKLVLVIEDMDRLDPSHLFRILNIFGAHLDYGLRFLPNGPTQNKFGFDNVVFVMDYDNVEEIYRHFYGVDSDFKGYISKFADKGYFKYSLRETAIDYFYVSLNMATGLPEDLIKRILSFEDLMKHSVRELYHGLDGATLQVSRFNNPHKQKYDFLILLAVMRRLRMKDEEIVKKLTTATAHNPQEFVKYAAKDLDSLSFLNKHGNGIILKNAQGKEDWLYVKFDKDDNVDIMGMLGGSMPDLFNANEFWMKMLEQVIP